MAKFTLTPKASAEDGMQAVSLEGYNTILEACLADAQGDAKACEAMDVEMNLLELASMPGPSEAFESLNATERSELANAFGMEAEQIKAMKPETFREKIYDLLPIKAAEIDAGQEGAELAIAGIACFIYGLIVIAAIISTYNQEQKFIQSMWRKLETAFKDGDKDYLNEIVVHGWKQDELEKSCKGCEGALKFLKQDLKKLFDPSVKLSDIEKVGANMWTSDLSYVDDVKKCPEWWGSWKDNCPEPAGGTLKELGFDTKSLTDLSGRFGYLCAELMKFKELQREAANAKSEYDKDHHVGLFGRIKRWFTESKEQKQERLQAEFLVSTKYQAINNLMWGFKQTVKTGATMLYQAAVKGDKILTKYKKD